MYMYMYKFLIEGVGRQSEKCQLANSIILMSVPDINECKRDGLLIQVIM